MRSAPPLLAAAASLLAAAFLLVRCGGDVGEGGGGGSPGSSAAEAPVPTREAGSAASRAADDGPPRITAAGVCPGAGYLCHELGAEGLRVQRWPEDRSLLTIRLHPPPVADPVRADRIRRAAVQGLLAWHGIPFPLRVLDRAGVDDEAADIEIRWQEVLEGGELGRVRAEWHSDGRGNLTFRVTEFILALDLGAPHLRPLTPPEVRRTAAHEMGHALGLGHSDSPGDLMYPTNTAEDVSVRDYRTLEALYALPNGAVVVP